MDGMIEWNDGWMDDRWMEEWMNEVKCGWKDCWMDG